MAAPAGNRELGEVDPVGVELELGSLVDLAVLGWAGLGLESAGQSSPPVLAVLEALAPGYCLVAQAALATAAPGIALEVVDLATAPVGVAQNIGLEELVGTGPVAAVDSGTVPEPVVEPGIDLAAVADPGIDLAAVVDPGIDLAAVVDPGIVPEVVAVLGTVGVVVGIVLEGSPEELVDTVVAFGLVGSQVGPGQGTVGLDTVLAGTVVGVENTTDGIVSAPGESGVQLPGLGGHGHQANLSVADILVLHFSSVRIPGTLAACKSDSHR